MFQEVCFSGINNIKLLKTLLCDQLQCNEEELDYKKVTTFTLEHKNLLKINCLWPLCNLKQLNLSNNFIKRIENLDSLIYLEDLNLSFNEISKIENLQTLIKLRKLSLYSNKIEKLENLENLKNIKILNLGANCIKDPNCPFYFAQFKNLQSLVISENPCYSQPNEINEYLLALMPQILDLNYKRITDKDRYLATSHYKMKTKGLKKFRIAKAEKIRNKLPKISDTAPDTAGTKFLKKIFENYTNILELSNKGENYSSLNAKFRKKLIELYQQIEDCKTKQKQILNNHNNIYDDLEMESIAAKRRLVLNFSAYNSAHLDNEKLHKLDSDSVKRFRMALLEEECNAQYQFEKLFKELENKLTSETAKLENNVKVILANINQEIYTYSATMTKYITNGQQTYLETITETELPSKEHSSIQEVNPKDFFDDFQNHSKLVMKDTETQILRDLREWQNYTLEMFMKNLVRHRKSVSEIKRAVEALKVNEEKL